MMFMMKIIQKLKIKPIVSRSLSVDNIIIFLNDIKNVN